MSAECSGSSDWGKCSFADQLGQRRCVFGLENVVLLTSLVKRDAFSVPKR
ncbi:hypothetical protein BIFGAL_04160 [Bifidobacterium gallicum DSM 20093 = LMG 11596]|uniref:Uncharacterized protein n=1 Tax=Bifidobacterium gallicum DSM 20093 = LMG 11596 TaxID=561180 RepID=D1NWB3_9BIFI|nr:hypothetical protein BIFGAL_04160 [Bifidobacterium gallicum DSM 20093 = LMG 11596]